MRLVIDTATRHAVVALGGDGGALAATVREVVPGRGTPLLSFIDETLRAAGVAMADVEAIGVGTGPGSFTGLRAGLATAKTLCWSRELPLVALPTDMSIRRAVALAHPGLGEAVAVLLPAGAHDHYLALPHRDPALVPPAGDLAALVGSMPVAAIDLGRDGVPAGLAAGLAVHGHPDAIELGAAALERLPAALLALMGERLLAGSLEDPATLVPRYVALPRGIAVVPVETGTTLSHETSRERTWSPTPR
jgi:tRNA threonylcarbamoyladenosine biosynthesis protein TsaB